MSKIIYMMLAMLGGTVIPIQSIITQALKTQKNVNQLDATFVLYLGGTIVSLIACLLINKEIVFMKFNISDWWMWTSGCFGFFYIVFMFLAFPRIGVSNSLVLVFIGQIIASVVIDNYGLFGMPKHPVNLIKLFAFALIIIGAYILMTSNDPS
ncbi:MAG: hypothetical protein CENE_00210 [Candidatus Celerinatantimonas neptuna]|nr:MAG: hypothetical protein CENE_00210 [Candidatus Celerinatantimonas neptuna]